MTRRVLLLGTFMLALPAMASAACTNPAYPEGAQYYNSTHHVMQYCDGTNWVNMGAPSGGVEDGDKGDITVSGDGLIWGIDTGAVALSDISSTGTASSSTFLRGDGAWTAIDTSIADGDKGDVTVSSSGTAWSVDSGAISLSKMANMATASILGRNTAGTGAPEAATTRPGPR